MNCLNSHLLDVELHLSWAVNSSVMFWMVPVHHSDPSLSYAEEWAEYAGWKDGVLQFGRLQGQPIEFEL